jgi:hypothetical protein
MERCNRRYLQRQYDAVKVGNLCKKAYRLMQWVYDGLLRWF